MVELTIQQKKIGEALLNRVGNTPLIALPRIGQACPGVRLLAKAEWFNPGGSVKDRAASNIIREAEETGRLTKEKILLDASSGNTAIAYAMIGSAKGYRVKLCVPANASGQVKEILAAYGAEVVPTCPLESSDGAIRRARRIVQEEPQTYYYADQYNNPANWRAHYHSTGPEIWRQTQGEVTHFLAGLGTSGTLMGTGRFLKEKNPQIQVVSMQPDSPLHGLEGLKHMETSIVPGIYSARFPDKNVTVQTEAAYDCVKQLAREEGLLVGISSGAALAAALKLAEQIQHGTIVMIFPDGGSRYLNEEFWKR